MRVVVILLIGCMVAVALAVAVLMVETISRIMLNALGT